MKVEINPAIHRFMQNAERFGWVNTETNTSGMKFKREHRPKATYGWSASKKG